jgi:hypothetical protein
MLFAKRVGTSDQARLIYIRSSEIADDHSKQLNYLRAPLAYYKEIGSVTMAKYNIVGMMDSFKSKMGT